MTIFRIPILPPKAAPGSKPIAVHLPETLRCKDFDDAGNRVSSDCEHRFKAGAVGDYHKCRGLKEGRCQKGAFLYPRKKREDGTFHYHQGIDISAETGRGCISVLNGTVVSVHKLDDNDGYGRHIAIKGTYNGKVLYVLYAHCDDVRVEVGQRVTEQQLIGTVGHSGNPGPKGPHLHFECSHRALPGKRYVETVLGDELTDSSPHIDPLVVLEKLGPWGSTEVFYPHGFKVTAEETAILHRLVELAPSGGYFPLGGNNTWHGGVHFPRPQGATIFAPFEATIVAARLDPDPKTALGPSGHVNFILLRHEISEEAYRRLQFRPTDPPPPDPKGPKAPKKPKKPPPPAVGRDAPNDPAFVVEVKHLLHDAKSGPYYQPADPASLDDPAVDDALVTAIKVFQKQKELPYPFKKKGKPWPDGVITKGFKTWEALLDDQPKPTPTPGTGPSQPADDGPTDTPDELDPKRTVYCLFMHLDPRPLDATTATSFPWLKDVVLAPRADEVDVLHGDDARKHDGDEEEAVRGIKSQVGYDALEAPTSSDPDDVKWVQKRLVRFGYFRPGVDPATAIDGEFTDELRAAIAEFQRAHVPYYDPAAKKGAPAVPPGYVTVKGDTHKKLKKTYAKLFGTTKPPVDPVFAHRAATKRAGRAQVLTGLDVTIAAGAPLWASGLAEGFADAASGGAATRLMPQFHWELFSSDALVEPWPILEDGDDDLTLDVPAKIFDRIEFHELPGFAKDKILRPVEITEFYASQRSEFFRTMQCRFRSEWGLDIGATVARLHDAGFRTDGLADKLARYLWWDEAGSAVPADRHVWHYNPIEFLARYERVLASMRPPTEPPPRTPGSVEVRVAYRDGAPMQDALVHLAHEDDVLGSLWTGLDGRAQFEGVPPGPCGVWIDGTSFEAAFPLSEGETRLVDLVTDVAPPATSTGTLRVIVVRADGALVDGVEVVISPDPEGPRITDADGLVEVELPQGYYTVATGQADLAAIALVAGTVATQVLEIRDTGAVVVHLGDWSGRPVGDERVALTEIGGFELANASTDADGNAWFTGVPGGDYEVFLVRAHEVNRSITVTPGATEPVALVLPTSDVPAAPGEAALDVLFMGRTGVLGRNKTVYLLDEDGTILADRTTNDEGRTSFEELGDGTYGLSSADATTDELGILLGPGERRALVLAYSEPAKPPPAVEPSVGTLAVTAFFASGSPCIGLWVKVASKGATLRSAMLDATSSVVISDVPARRVRVFVDGREDAGVDVDVVASQRVPVVLVLPNP